MTGNGEPFEPEDGRLAVVVPATDDPGVDDVEGRLFIVLAGAGAVVVAVPAGTAEGPAGGAVLVARGEGGEI